MQRRLGSRPMAVVRLIWYFLIFYIIFSCTGRWFLFPAMPSDNNDIGYQEVGRELRIAMDNSQVFAPGVKVTPNTPVVFEGRQEYLARTELTINELNINKSLNGENFHLQHIPGVGALWTYRLSSAVRRPP